MPYVRVRVIGNGTNDDPIRIPLPTYRYVADAPGNTWIVEVRDEDLPPGLPAPINANVPGLGQIQVINAAGALAISAWVSLLDKRYPQRDKRADPQIA